MMYHIKDITQVHLEITSRCNAACPMCARTDTNGQVHPALPLVELTLADIQTIFPESFVRQLQQMFLCGNYGDAMTARDTVEVFEYLRTCNPGLDLRMMTNGSGRTPAWWTRLARVVNTCQFAIDGLEDTNHLYRRGTHWTKIMESARAFIGAGGRAQWMFIVFRHNEHQVEEARALSRQLGFAEFFVKPTNRFAGVGADAGAGSLAVRGRDGTVLYQLKVPRNHAYRHRAKHEFAQVVKSAASYRSYIQQVPIRCQAVEKRQVFVSAEGLVFPCCWTAQIYPRAESPYSTEVLRLIDQMPGGKEAINARLRPLREIVEGPFFQRLIPESWRQEGQHRLQVCCTACGQYRLQTTPVMKPLEEGATVDAIEPVTRPHPSQLAPELASEPGE